MLDTIVNLKVGPTKTPFEVHKGLLCNASPYFRAALEGGFKEATTQTIEWPEETPGIIKEFLFWLYSGSLSEEETSDRPRWNFLVNLYIFAEVRGLHALQNAVMDGLLGLIQKKTSALDVGVLDLIYQQASPQSLLRRLAVDLFVRHYHLKQHDWFRESFLKNYPKEFMADVIIGQHVLLKDGALGWNPEEILSDRTKYHTAAAE